MLADEQSTNALPEKAHWFTTTHWSIVLAARDDEATAAPALEQLCRTYWYPLYAYARRCEANAHDAQDSTQGFFAQLLEKDYLAQADREKGRFRSFLLAAFKHFMSAAHARATAAKRGGGQLLISLDDDTAEDRYRLEPATDLSPDVLFERQWAVALLDRALAQLRREYEAENKVSVFDRLKPFLGGDVSSGDYAPVAAQLNLTPGAVAVVVHRMRQRYRDLVRAEVAHTVASPADVDEEMRHLFAALAR